MFTTITVGNEIPDLYVTCKVGHELQLEMKYITNCT
jgi:hypothetical protein